MNILGQFLESMLKTSKNEIDSFILDFAKQHFLYSKSLKEIYYNFLQIVQIFDSLIDDDGEKMKNKDFFETYKFPTPQ